MFIDMQKLQKKLNFFNDFAFFYDISSFPCECLPQEGTDRTALKMPIAIADLTACN
jgi:hypothetical protein